MQAIASRLSALAHIVFRAATGASRFTSINIHAPDHPVCSSSHVPTGGDLIGDRTNIGRQDVPGAQSVEIWSNIQAMRYTRTDTGETCLGHVADEVEVALAELGVSNVTGSTRAAPGDLPYGSFKTLDYACIVPLLASGINRLADRAHELETLRTK